MTDTRSPAPDATATVRVCGIKFIRSAFGLWRCVYIDGSLGAPSDAELSHQNYLDAIAELAAALRAEQEKGKALDSSNRAVVRQHGELQEEIGRLQQRVTTFEALATELVKAQELPPDEKETRYLSIIIQLQRLAPETLA